MNSAPEGWFVDPSTGTNLRYWNGTTWTNEIAPLPKAANTGPIDLFRDAITESTAAVTAAEPVPDPGPGLADDSAEGELEPEIELTQLSRRELRVRRGGDIVIDDAPRHLPGLAPEVSPSARPAAIPFDQWLKTRKPTEVDSPSFAPTLQVAAPAPVAPTLQIAPETELAIKQGPWRTVILWGLIVAVLAVGTSVTMLATQFDVALPGG